MNLSIFSKWLDNLAGKNRPQTRQAAGDNSGIKIAIVSVLKPVNDTRMYEKIAKTAVTYLQAEVLILGYSAENALPDNPAIKFFPFFRFSRLSLGRLKAPFTTLRFLLTAKPDIVIVNSPDLWIVTIVGRILFGYVLLADVRENYKLNVLKTEVWPKMLRLPLALYIRATEKLCYFFCSGFILAEKVYTQQLPFVTNSGKPVVIAENKVPKGIISDFKARKTPVLPPSGVIRLLYTGTIALHYGIFEAIDLACALHAINPEISLTIAGYCADKQLFEQLKARLLPCPFITLIGGEKPVSHQILLKLMTEAHFGLLPYRSSPATAGKIPTKLYEYQAFTLPMIIQRNKDWESISNAAEAGIMIDYTNFDAQDILDVLTTRLFYTKGVPNEIWWEEEIPALVSMLAGFYKNKN